MTMTEAALPYVEALAALREEAVRNGHEMAPAEWLHGTLTSGCTRCAAGCGVYARSSGVGLAELVRWTDKPCEPAR